MATETLLFDAIHEQLYEALCTLTCAVAALDKADSEDQPELAGRALSMLRRCEHRLTRVHDQLDGWHVTHEHATRGIGE